MCNIQAFCHSPLARDSKLTAILRPNFAAPNSKVLLIANAAPAQGEGQPACQNGAEEE